MSCYRRPKVTGARVFLTINLALRGSDSLVRHINVLRWAVAVTRSEMPFGIDAWVVLPDHMHCVWAMPKGDKAYGARVGAIKARFSSVVRNGAPRASHINRRELGVWQRRFWEHHITDQQEWQEHIAYCWQNPVRHGLVDRVADWPYSSWHRDHQSNTVSAGR